MGCISGLLFGILQFAALVLIAIGTPLAMFLPRSDNPSRITIGYCITMWGIRDYCLVLDYSAKPAELWAECSGRASRFKAAQVCSIAAIIILAASMLANILDTCCCFCFKYLSQLMNVAAVVVLTVCWGSLLDCYLQNQGSHIIDNVDVCVALGNFPGVDNAHPEGMTVGAGFILLVIATAISFVNIFILFIPC